MHRNYSAYCVANKVKKNEIAKPGGKYARLYGDFGVPASLLGFVVMELLKAAQAGEPLTHNGVEIEFVKRPTKLALKRSFDKLIAPELRGYVALFSDDSCISLKAGDQLIRANLDIASCDASHRQALFDFFPLLVPAHVRADVEALIDQCKLPATFTSPHNKRHSVTIKSLVARLSSGSTITTALNNFATLLIAVAMAEATIDPLRPLAPQFQAAAISLGYEITVSVCNKIEDLQFVKYSPVLDIFGIYQPVLNPGVFIRGFGSCTGDLVGQGPIADRANQFDAAVLAGMYPTTSIPLFDKLRRPTSGTFTKLAKDLLTYKVYPDPDTDYSTYHTDDEVFRRYDLTSFESADLQCLAECSYGIFVGGQHYTQILHKDYGLECYGYPVDESRA
jgi:hypothetical protein